MTATNTNYKSSGSSDSSSDAGYTPGQGLRSSRKRASSSDEERSKAASPSSIHSVGSCGSLKPPPPKPTLIEEADEALAQSLLMFLYADLRLLSATGRIYTKFETLCIDSDLALKHTSAELAAVDKSTFVENEHGEIICMNENGQAELPCSGISPSQIMAALMLEIKQEIEEHERLMTIRRKSGVHKWRYQTQQTSQYHSQQQDNMEIESIVTDSQQDDDEDEGYMTEDEVAAAEHEDKRLFEEFIFTKSHHKKKFFQAEEDMHSLLKAYNEMIKEDQNPDFKGVNARRHLSIFLEQADELVEETRIIKSRRSESANDSPSSNSQHDGSSTNSSTNNDNEEMKQPHENSIQEEEEEDILFEEKIEDTKRKNNKKRVSIGDRTEIGFENQKVKHLHPNDIQDTKGLQQNDHDNDDDRNRPNDRTISNATTSEGSASKLEIQSGAEVLDADQSDSPPIVTNDTFEDEDAIATIRRNHDFDISNMAEYDDDDVSKATRLRKSVKAMLMDRKQAFEMTRFNLRESRQAFIDRQHDFMANIKSKAGHLVPEDQELGVAKEMADVGNLLFRSIGEDADRVLTPDEIKKIMERAVTSRVYGDLNFMADFFRPGTVSRLMAESKSRVVWLNDWYPIKDLVYAISFDKEKKRVQVVFRGAITQADWNHAYDLRLRVVANPVKQDFKGRRKTIEVYHGFYRYLFRPRKDSGGSTKYDEICSKVHKYGMEKIGADYEVVTIGFSLGGALSTLFGLYASTDNRFTNAAPIKMFTFGSPMVGGHAFADSFRHQEKTGKLQYARFINARDSVAHFPLNLIPSRRGSKFVHVGVEIWVPRKFLTLSCLQSHLPAIHYPPKEGWVKSYWRALRTSGLFNMPWPWRIKIVHSLDEHKRRLLRAKRACDKHTDHLANKSLDEVYQLLVTGRQT